MMHGLKQKVEKEKPNIVVLQGGGNDLQSLTGQNPISPLALANDIIGAGKHTTWK